MRAVLVLLLLGVAAVSGAYLDYDYIDLDGFEIMGGHGGYGRAVTFVQPVVTPIQQQAVYQKPAQIVQPILNVQPVYQQTKAQPIVQQAKTVQYAQPIVTYAQPIVQQVDMAQPIMQKQQLSAQPIIQPTFQTAPVQFQQAITATAPTIQKGFGSGQNLGLGGYGGMGLY